MEFGLVANADIGLETGSQDGPDVCKISSSNSTNPTITYNNLYCDSETYAVLKQVNDTHELDFGGRINFSLASTVLKVLVPLNIYPSDVVIYKEIQMIIQKMSY